MQNRFITNAVFASLGALYKKRKKITYRDDYPSERNEKINRKE